MKCFRTDSYVEIYCFVRLQRPGTDVRIRATLSVIEKRFETNGCIGVTYAVVVKGKRAVSAVPTTSCIEYERIRPNTRIEVSLRVKEKCAQADRGVGCANGVVLKCEGSVCS